MAKKVFFRSMVVITSFSKNMKILKLFIILVPLFGLTSCGVLTGLMGIPSVSGASVTGVHNVSNVNTNVELSKKNFVVLGNVSGSTNNWYLFGIGGLISRNLLGEAYREMERKANLSGTSRVIINVTYDVHTTWILIYQQYKITVTGTVIEFIDDDDTGMNVYRNSNINSNTRPNTNNSIIDNVRNVFQSRPNTNENTNNSSLTRVNEAQQIANEGTLSARQTSDYNTAQVQQRSSQTQQGIQVEGWYYAIASNGTPTRTAIRLIVQRRETGQGFPQYSILSIDGRAPNQSTIASYNNDAGAYVFSWGNSTVYFNVNRY